MKLLGDGGDVVTGEVVPGTRESERARKRRQDVEDREWKRWQRGGMLAALLGIAGWIVNVELFRPALTDVCQAQLDARNTGTWPWFIGIWGVYLLTAPVGIGLKHRWQRWRAA